MENLIRYKDRPYSEISLGVGGYDKAYIHRAFHRPGAVKYKVFMKIMSLVGCPADEAKAAYLESRREIAEERERERTEKLMSK